LSLDGWIHTGDLVKRIDDRVVFVGRKSDMVNVGGYKVHPVEVERVVMEVPGVADVRVFAKRSSIAGQLVACDILPEVDVNPTEVEQAVRSACLSRLASYQRPRIIRVVDEIALTSAGKKTRK
jgi:acyl-CoA synthetase (AMP-forming)/AMP-acid ligase II